MSLKARFMYAGGRVYWRLFRPLTLGVRLLMINEGRVLLVKHSYQPGWFLPGGGVKKRESLEEAARREAWEEVGAKLGSLILFGAYSNLGESKSDHILVFLCQDFTLEGESDFEIERWEIFPLGALPEDISIGSHRRIREYLDGYHEQRAAKW